MGMIGRSMPLLNLLYPHFIPYKGFERVRDTIQERGVGKPLAIASERLLGGFGSGRNCFLAKAREPVRAIPASAKIQRAKASRLAT
jgi:hypothetical protein